MDTSPKRKSKMSTSSSKSSHSALQPQLQEQAKELRNTVRDPLATRPLSRNSGPHEVQPGDIFAESQTQNDMRSKKSGNGDGSGEENIVDERWMMGEGDTIKGQGGREGEDLKLRDKKYVDLASPTCFASMLDED